MPPNCGGAATPRRDGYGGSSDTGGMRLLIATLALALAACGPSAPRTAAAQTDGGVEIQNAWASPTPNGVDVSAGYLTIVNTGRESDRLVAATSPRASRLEVHDMIMQGSVMQMRPAGVIEIEAGARIELAPSGRHLMFFGVAQPFVEGEDIPVLLQFERAGGVEAHLRVQRGAQHRSH